MSRFTYEMGYEVPLLDELSEGSVVVKAPERDGVLHINVDRAQFEPKLVRISKVAGRVTLSRKDRSDTEVFINCHSMNHGGDVGYDESLGGYTLFDRPLRSFAMARSPEGTWVPRLDVSYANPLALQAFISVFAEVAYLRQNNPE